MRYLTGFAVVVGLVTGCSGGGYNGPKLYPVTGKLTKGGAPLGGINISLVSPDGGNKAPPLVALTKDDGTFEIMTSSGQKGAPIGVYKVVIIAPAPEFDYKTAKGPPKPSTLIPAKYGQASSTDQTFEVKAGNNVMDLSL
jgi:hypothetical protein